MTKNKKRRAFTLVELLVVIAILAILSTVTVVGYTSFTKKANLSNDQTMIKMINDNLLATSVEKVPTSASEALTDLYTVGFSSEKLIPYSAEHHYAYSLENNKMYLINEDDQVIYPENANVEVSSLWGFYRNDDKDKITGITKYVAMEPVINKAKFDAVMDSNYEIDLNNFVITVNPGDKTGIVVSNGSIINADHFTPKEGDEESVTTKKVATASKLATSNIVVNKTAGSEKIEVKDYYVEQANSQPMIKNMLYLNENEGGTKAKELTFKNITIDGSKTTESFKFQSEIYKDVEKITFENCTFINHEKFALYIGFPKTVMDIHDCIFINCKRGINIAYNGGKVKTYDKSSADLKIAKGSVIERNTFILDQGDKSNAIQFAAFYDENMPVDSSTPAITIKDNHFISAKAAYTIHADFAIPKNVHPGRTSITPANIAKLFKFENNEYKGLKDKVVLDVDYYLPEYRDSEATKTAEKIRAALVGILK